MRIPPSFWFLACAVVLSACGGGGSGNPCTQGDQKACACPGGAPDGVQVCLGDGTWGACDCGASTSTGGDGTGGNSTGSNNTGGTSIGGTSTGGTGIGGTSTGGTSTGGTGGVTTTTTPPLPCDNIFQGSFTILNTIDVNTISPYCEIDGDLSITGTVNGAGLSSLSLPNLRKVDGKITMTGSVMSFLLPALESAQSLTASANSMDLSALVELTSPNGVSWITVKGPLSLPAFVSNAGHTTLDPAGDVDLPELITGGDLSVAPTMYPCPGAFKLFAPKLQTAKDFFTNCLTGLDVSSATDLGAMTIMVKYPEAIDISLPKLTTARWLIVNTKGTVSAPLFESTWEGDVRLESVSSASLPKLKSTAADLVVYDLGMSTLSLPALEMIGGYFKLGGSNSCNGNPPPDPNLYLTAFDLPKLTTIGAIQNTNWIDLGPNPVLPQCRLDALTNQLKSHGWTGFVFNSHPNVCVLAAGPCP